MLWSGISQGSRGGRKGALAAFVTRNVARFGAGLIGLALAVFATQAVAAQAVAAQAVAAQAGAGFLGQIHRTTMINSTVPENGDQNPYAVVVAPVSSGKIKKGDVLVDNFNDDKNLQGLGSTIVSIDPATKKMSLFAAVPRHLAGCPGGVGLTAAMTMLKSGWVIVGSMPSRDGTTATKGQGCLVVLDNQGRVASTIAGPNINGPWGNMALIDDGSTATLFVSNTGFGVGAPTDNAPVIRKATVLRLKLQMKDGKPPKVVDQTVVASGFGEQADRGVFVIGPTGLTLGTDGVLYVSDAIDNRIVVIPNAATRTDSAGTGKEVSKNGFLQRPLALAMTPNGHVLATNALNGQIVEIDPKSGKQIAAKWIDKDKAQRPPGSGDLFGFALAPSGKAFYYVEDDLNTLVVAH